MLKKSLFSPAQSRCAKTHLSPSSVLNTREAYLVIRAGLSRRSRKAGLVGGFIFVSRACRARLACPAHNPRTTDEEDDLVEHPVADGAKKERAAFTCAVRWLGDFSRLFGLSGRMRQTRSMKLPAASCGAFGEGEQIEPE